MARRILNFSQQQLERMAKEYTVEGKTLPDLAKEHGCSIPTIRNRLVGMGVIMRPKGRRAKKVVRIDAE